MLCAAAHRCLICKAYVQEEIDKEKATKAKKEQNRKDSKHKAKANALAPKYQDSETRVL